MSAPPTFQQMRRAAFHRLGDAEDALEVALGSGPTSEQTETVREARVLIAKAKAALDRAAH